MKLIQKLSTGAAAMVLLFSFTACNDETSDGSVQKKVPVAEQPAMPEPGADSVNLPQQVNAEADGTLRLTAAKGKGVGPDIKFMPEWRAFGWFTAKDKVEWEVSAPKAGDYDVELDWSVADEDAGKEFLLEANGEKLTGIIVTTGSWETYKKAMVGKIKLREGLQTVAFKSNKDFDKGAILDLRELKLTPSK